MQLGMHDAYVHPRQVKVLSQNFVHCASTTGSGESGNGSGVESAVQGCCALDEDCPAAVAVGVDDAPVPEGPGGLGDADPSSTASAPAILPPHAAVTAMGAMPTRPRIRRGIRCFIRTCDSRKRALADERPNREPSLVLATRSFTRVCDGSFTVAAGSSVADVRRRSRRSLSA